MRGSTVKTLSGGPQLYHDMEFVQKNVHQFKESRSEVIQPKARANVT